MNGDEMKPAAEVQAAAELLDRILILLREMYRLAERASSDDCSPAERALLHRDLDGLRARIDRLNQIYEAEYGSFPQFFAEPEKGEVDRDGTDSGTVYRF